jgi:hypothetical protein
MPYLITEITYFVDGHGTPAEGAKKKSVVEETTLTTTPEGMYNNGEDDVDEDNIHGSYDSYHSRYYRYIVEELTEEEAINAKSVIQYYNAL